MSSSITQFEKEPYPTKPMIADGNQNNPTEFDTKENVSYIYSTMTSRHGNLLQ